MVGLVRGWRRRKGRRTMDQRGRRGARIAVAESLEHLDPSPSDEAEAVA